MNKTMNTTIPSLKSQDWDTTYVKGSDPELENLLKEVEREVSWKMQGHWASNAQWPRERLEKRKVTKQWQTAQPLYWALNAFVLATYSSEEGIEVTTLSGRVFTKKRVLQIKRTALSTRRMLS